MIDFDDCYLRTFNEKNNLKSGGLLYRIPANPKNGFNFEYLLFIPNGINSNTSLILESMNYITCKTENPQEKIEYMYELYKSFRNPLHYCNQKSLFPIVYPLIPRYFDENLNEEIYLNMLSSNSFHVTNELFKRVDLQIINMLKDAKRRLKNNNINADDKIIIYGFSASSKFANRFALLHPEEVKLVIAGGLAGTLIIPFKTFENENLLYPIGIYNMEEITKEKVSSFTNIKQFYYQDINDPIDSFKSVDDLGVTPFFPGIINEDELKQLYRILGKDIKTRWKSSQEIYNHLCKDITFKTYKIGEHKEKSALEEIKGLLENEIKKDD